jgi:hypothetical protein
MFSKPPYPVKSAAAEWARICAAKNPEFAISSSYQRCLADAAQQTNTSAVIEGAHLWAPPETAMPRRRALRALGHTTHMNLVRLELTGHDGRCVELDCEVEFFDDAAGREISSVQPYETRTLESGRKGTLRHFLETPPWLEELLVDCIDPDSLDARL